MKFKSINSIILLMIFACVLMMNGDVFAKENNEIIDNEIENSDWYSAAMKNIEESEYYIRYNDNTNTFQSPNRKNNLRFHYLDNGFTVNSRNCEMDWEIGIYLISYGRDDLKDYTGGELIIDRNTGIVKNENISIEYINNNKGMRENFIVHQKINGEGLLELHLEIDGNAEYEVNNNGIIFKKNDERVMEYKDLYVYDSNNNELKSTFKKTANGVKILINDKNAIYPITIDPLSTTPDWTKESNQAYAYYGYSVSSAGDVNGDGYSDIIVGAYGYDNGEIDEGMVFVYYGSSTGPSAAADWIGESNQVNARYGNSVASAGDVNGDGFSDIIVGANWYDNGQIDEGMVFVYYGSSTGPSAAADWIGESNQVNARYGNSVASAGDVNGDG
ncbi:FG-GAP repeat protein, partial [candidate division WOR-3 bacterium]|nr:FG-GAP repeat protein [candidate division WOR-3 bacterium]